MAGKKKRLIINAFCEAWEVQGINYQSSVERTRDTFWSITSTVNKVLYLDVSEQTHPSQS